MEQVDSEWFEMTQGVNATGIPVSPADVVDTQITPWQENYREGTGRAFSANSDTDTQLKLPGCVHINDNGVIHVTYNSTCKDEERHPICEYKGKNTEKNME